MKAFSFSVLLFVFFVASCTHSLDPAPFPTPPVAPPQTRRVMVVSDPVQVPPPSPEMLVKSETKSVVDDYGDIDVPEKSIEEAKAEIADPLEPFNRAMYHFNDKLYFWLLKPVAQGYGRVNDASFKIDDYESLKEAAIDPYVAIRDAYVQYRMNRVNKANLDK